MAMRFVYSRRAVGPQVVADESAYLAMARGIADVGEVWYIGPASAYSPGYSFVIAPLFRLVHEPVLLFRSIVGVNIVLGGLLFLTYEALARRLTNVRRPWTALIATIAATLPSLVLTANHAWSDNLTPLAFALVLLCGLRALERPTSLSVMLLAVLVGAAFLTHTRLAVLAVPTALLLLHLWRGRRLRWYLAIGALAAMLVSLLVASRLTKLVQEPIYPPGWSGEKSVGEDLLHRLTSVGPFVLSFAGQLWYLLATTVGVAGFALTSLARGTVRELTRWWDRRRRPAGAPAETSDLEDLGLAAGGPALAYTITTLVLSFGISVAFMTDRERSDQLVYGRYNEAFLGVLVLIGLASLMASRFALRQRIVNIALAATMLVGTGGLIWLARLDLLQQRGATSTVLGLFALSQDPVQSVRRVTLVALILLILMALASTVSSMWSSSSGSGRSVIAVGLLAVLLVPLGVDRASGPLALVGSQKAVSFASASDLVRRGDMLWFAMNDGGNTSQFYRLPFYLDDVRVDRRVEGDPWIDGPELMIGSFDSKMAPRSGYRVVWADPNGDLAIWVAPGSRQDEYERAGELFPDPPTEPLAGDADTAVDLHGLTLDDRRLTAVATIDRVGDGPWAGLSADAVSSEGRVAVRAVIESSHCACVVAKQIVQLDRFVPVDLDELEVDVELDLTAVPEGSATVEVQLFRGSEDPFASSKPVAVRIG